VAGHTPRMAKSESMVSFRQSTLLSTPSSERERAVLRTLLSVLEDAIAADDLVGAADIAEQIAAQARRASESPPSERQPTTLER
jgi:hypothetical protein